MNLICDLPSVHRQVADPELFYSHLDPGSEIIFDEIHRFENTSLVLKITADHFPHFKILATGSSTLAATKKFRDTLTGRKVTIYLSPVLKTECQEVFEVRDLDRRLLHGELPEPLLATEKDPAFLSEWIDSFYS